MKKINILFLSLLLILITGCTINSKTTTSQTTSTTESTGPMVQSSYEYYEYFDTYSVIKIWDTKSYPKDDQIWKDLDSLMAHIQNTFQTDIKYETDENGETIKDSQGNGIPLPFTEQSELYQLNLLSGTGIPFKCTDDLYEIIKTGIQYAEETNGKLDPTIEPLVELWDINAHVKEEYDIPSATAIDKLLPLVDYHLIQVDDTKQTVILKEPGMALNLGAISKGFAADKIYEFLKSRNIEHALIYLGGNMYALGPRYEEKNGSNDWVIGISDPNSFVPGAYMGTLNVIDKTVVTSGVYERYIIDPETGKLYSHILNPETGYSVDNNLLSVSIITDNSTKADALSTSIFALGLEDGMKFINNDPSVEAIFITKDKKVYVSSGIDQYSFNITNDKYELATINEQ